jgi:hypothetical protein
MVLKFWKIYLHIFIEMSNLFDGTSGHFYLPVHYFNIEILTRYTNDSFGTMQ